MSKKSEEKEEKSDKGCSSSLKSLNVFKESKILVKDSRIFWQFLVAIKEEGIVIKLQKKHQVVSFTKVNPTLLAKSNKLPLLIQPIDQEFVQDLALYMMKNLIAIVVPWCCNWE